MSQSSNEVHRYLTAMKTFRVAMDHASDENLRLLHGGLEKSSMPIVRGSWGGENRQACPLTTLFVGVPRDPEDANRSARLATYTLRRCGFEASDFYGPWDRGLVSTRRLLWMVDLELSRRAKGEKSKSRGADGA